MTDMYRGKRVMVLGGAGLLGSHVVKELLGRGASVSATTHLKRPVIGDFRIEYRNVDLTTREGCRIAVKDVDYVFACAASSSGAAVMRTNPVAHITTNLLINSQVFEAAARGGVERLLFVSSITVYPPANHAVKEEEAFQSEPHEAYFGVGWMKRYIEKLAEFYNRNYPIRINSVRPTNIYGPHDKFDFNTSQVLPALIRRAVEGADPYEVWGDGNAVRDFIYAADAAQAVVKMMEKDVDVPLNLGSGKLVTIKESVDLIRKLTGHTGRVVYNTSKPTTIPYRAVDLTRLKRVLDWEATTSFTDGLQNTIDWYRSTLGATTAAR